MLLCSPYVQNLKYDNEVNEYNILFKKDSKVEKLLGFLNDFSDKTINIFCKEKETTEMLSHYLQRQDNVCFALKGLDENLCKSLKSKGFKYFYTKPARNFDMLSKILALGVDSIYITEDLWHFLPRVREICDNVKIRLQADLVGNYAGRDNDYTTFIPRPEDYKELEKYITVIEFTNTNSAVLQVLYHSWFETHQWYGYIGELIPNLRYDFYNPNISNNYAKTILDCGFVCVINGSPCRKCEHQIKLANKMANNNLILDRKNR